MRRLFLGLAGLLAATASAIAADTAGEAQTLVDRSALAVQEILGEGDAAARSDAQDMLRRARAVMVCPQVLRAGFILGGQGGGCVLLGRDAAGSWSSPAFYSLASGSLGLQVGLQDMAIIMMVLTDKGLSALMDSQFKLGADASVAIATVGAGVSGATTSAAGAAVPSDKAVAVTRCEPALPAVLPGLLARLADPGDAFGMRELVIGVRRGFVEAFAAEKRRGGRG